MYLTVKIPDMSCNHCKMAIEKILIQFEIDTFDLNLDTKIVKIEGDLETEKIISEIKKVGYSPQILSQVDQSK